MPLRPLAETALPGGLTGLASPTGVPAQSRHDRPTAEIAPAFRAADGPLLECAWAPPGAPGGINGFFHGVETTIEVPRADHYREWSWGSPHQEEVVAYFTG